MDGGIRTGNDVLKAIALGAKCVFIGRPAIWGLAYKVTVWKAVFLMLENLFKPVLNFNKLSDSRVIFGPDKVFIYSMF